MTYLCCNSKPDLMATWRLVIKTIVYDPPRHGGRHLFFSLYNLQAKPGGLGVGSLDMSPPSPQDCPLSQQSYLSFYPTLVSQDWILEQQATEPEFNNTLFLPKLLFSPSSESPHCQVHWSFLSSHPLIHDSTDTAIISLLHTQLWVFALGF